MKNESLRAKNPQRLYLFRQSLRIPEKYPNCRYAKKTQISLDLKKYRYGEIYKKGRLKIVDLYSRYHRSQ